MLLYELSVAFLVLMAGVVVAIWGVVGLFCLWCYVRAKFVPRRSSLSALSPSPPAGPSQ